MNELQVQDFHGKQVFSMPGAEERYQAWLKKYKAKQKRERFDQTSVEKQTEAF